MQIGGKIIGKFSHEYGVGKENFEKTLIQYDTLPCFFI
jgi:hypothetical protein